MTSIEKEPSLKILLVDNLKANLLALDGLLRREDVKIFKAHSGNEALELMIGREFAVALIDVHMPNMNGFELAELMRGANQTKNIPIIFVSATAKDQSFSFKGYEIGGVDFLLKPLDTHAVKSKVNIFLELYRQKKEQEELLAKLKIIQGELSQSVQIRDEFLSIVSHELKTPLNLLKIQTQLRKRGIRRGDVAAFSMERLTKMFDADEKQISRITRLIDEMLDISRISSGKLFINLEQFDLSELARDLVKQSAELFGGADCSVETDLQSVVGNWDRFRIEQVLLNLLTNAMRYGAGKPIFIQVHAKSDRARIVIRDQGRGIAKENHEVIFQKFERAAEGKEIHGLGLGLYIVKNIVEAHHGCIQVQSELGQGATFIIDLPINEAQNSGSETASDLVNKI